MAGLLEKLVFLPALIPLLPLFKGAHFIAEGERALLLRCNKVVWRNGLPRIAPPGANWHPPFFWRYERVSVQVRTIALPPQCVTLTNNTAYNVRAVITCQVRDTATDVLNARYATINLEKSLDEFGRDFAGLVRQVQ